MSDKINAFQIQAIPDTKYGFFKKIGSKMVPPVINIPVGSCMVGSGIAATLYIYVLSKKDILECELNLPMLKIILTKDDSMLCNVWLHFNTMEKMNITSDNFDDYVEKKLEGYFSVDVYKGSKHLTLETSEIFIGPKKVAMHVINLIQSNIQNILND